MLFESVRYTQFTVRKHQIGLEGVEAVLTMLQAIAPTLENETVAGGHDRFVDGDFILFDDDAHLRFFGEVVERCRQTAAGGVAHRVYLFRGRQHFRYQAVERGAVTLEVGAEAQSLALAEDGDVVVFQHGREKKVLAENMMDSAVYSTVVTANGTMFIMTRNNLYAISEGAQKR